jgi:hypothetical protein
MSTSLEGTEVQRLRLKPGDHIVIKIKDRISREQVKAIKNDAEKQWPGYPITVLSGDMDIAVVEGTAV